MRKLFLGLMLSFIFSGGILAESGGFSINNHSYPRFFQFRYSENLASSGKTSYEEWDKFYAPFDGIEGKVLDEEVPGRSAALAFFVRYKKEHPDKLVLLHNNGRGRDPRDKTQAYFAGHWLYYNGCKIGSSLRSNQDESEVEVENPRLFRVNMGLNKTSNEDLVICELTPEGKPDWNRAEQVKLLGIDMKRRILRIQRGCYGTEPRQFQAGKAWVAAHVCEGPWGPHSNLLWEYNYSLDCPRDVHGRNCTDLRVAELGQLFTVDGPLAGFDGLEFDVLMNELGGPNQLRGGRGIDSNGDGQIDNGWQDGINRFGLGVYQFLAQLRRTLGDGKLILADGMTIQHQRAFDQLNGIESEGWPILNDMEINDWSGGLNRLFFWNQNARSPVFSYINHKFRGKGESDKPVVPANINRLVLAVAQITDNWITYSDAPVGQNEHNITVWDELVKGVENQSGWLGMPVGLPIRLARQHTDLFAGKGIGMSPEFIPAFSGQGVRFSKQHNELVITSVDPKPGQTMRFRLNGLKTNGPDVTVFMTLQGKPMAGYPAAYSRWIRVKIAGDDVKKAIMSWVNSKPFAASFYFRDIKTKTVDLEFEVEGAEEVRLSNITAYAAPDVIYREFQNGLVLVNPALHEYSFDLQKYLPGKVWRRIRGSAGQDPITNNGTTVDKAITLQAKDGIFLIRMR